MNDSPTPIEAVRSENHITEVLGDECLLLYFPVLFQILNCTYSSDLSSLGIPKVAIWVRAHTPGFLMKSDHMR